MAARVDSGNETLFSGDSSPDTPSSHGSPHQVPPRITSTLTKGKVVIRPVAFKPLVPSSGRLSERYGSTPILARPGSHLTLYGSSNDLRHTHGSSSSNYSLDRKLRSTSPSALAMSSLPLTPSLGLGIGYDSMDSVHKSTLGYDSMDSVHKSTLGYDSMDSVHKSTTSSRNHHLSRMLASETGSGSLVDLTPSPTESGVMAELEAALRERDSEVAYLRQTMEHNEQVIFRVYQEKEKAWEREMRRIKALHENRLRTVSQKTHKLEQMLMMQTYQVPPAIILKETQGEQATKGHEVISLRSEIRELRLLLEQRDLEVSNLKSEVAENARHNQQLKEQHTLETDELTSVIAKLEAKLKSANVPESGGNDGRSAADDKVSETENCDAVAKLKKELAEERLEWERERVRWSQEKEKVLSYQRQLQLNYVHMYRHSKNLQAELESLSLELELDPKTRRKKQISLPHTAIQL
ncbi:leucine zipper putative tumor suppressor 2 homolog [Nilaparvata lugens]|uniref:leucine zipper putative tumor suppressor 2 homolog n=1 Tax=Nilaparvata lugens TaxID=108931 RepID=UPI00193D0835|nr:leucine zipper putative tumor suppressor 2 homolog [Nilaparvata lugens]